MVRPGHVVFLCALALLTLGVVMVGSAGMEIKPVAPGVVGATAGPQTMSEAVSSLVLSKNGLYLAMAVIAMSAMAMMPIGRILGRVDAERAPVANHRLGLLILGGGCLFLAAIVATSYMPGLSHPVNHSRRWIALPIPGLKSFTLQPSEFAKWGLIAVLAIYCAARSDLMKSFRWGLVPALLGIGMVGGIIAHQDLGTGVLVVAAGSVMLLAAGARFRHFALFIPPAIIGIIALIVDNPYRLRRIETFFDPYIQPQKAGYHMIQSMLAVSGGEGYGRGLGFGLQKYGYLPEDTTDFLFAIICEELGVVGAAGVIGLYILMLWAGLSIVKRQPSAVLKLFGLGVLTTIGLQALINLAVVTGLGPTKGIALPLISSGGTGWILTAASLGLLIAMDTDAEPATAPELPELLIEAKSEPELVTA